METKTTLTTAKPTFTLVDVPDNWEIDLDADFVKFLDRLNRPWHYDDNGNFRQGRKGFWTHRDSATFWEAGQYSKTRPRYEALRTPDYFRRYNFFEKLWGYHRYHDAHTGRYGHIKAMDRGNWITKENIATLREPFIDPLTDEDLELLVRGFRHSGASIWSRPVIVDRFPIVANKWYAWLLGIYYAAGAVYHHEYSEAKRECRVYPTMRLRLNEEVIPKVFEVLKNIGATGTLESELHRYPTGGLRPYRKTKSFRTLRRRNIKLGWPLLVILRKFGLHETDLVRDGHGSRTQSPVIPEWVKADEECMHAFIEGYLQGRGASVFAPGPQGPELEVMLRVAGNPKPLSRAFAKEIRKYFRRHHVPTTFRKSWNSTKDLPEFSICFRQQRCFKYLINHFDIKNTVLRARLNAMVKAKGNVKQILSETRTPYNTIFAIILDRPRTEKELEALLNMRPEGIRENLHFLEQSKYITEKDGVYSYDSKAYLRAKHKDIPFHIWDFTDRIQVKLNKKTIAKLRTMTIAEPFEYHDHGKIRMGTHTRQMFVTTHYDRVGQRLLKRLENRPGRGPAKPHEPFITISQLREVHERSKIPLDELEKAVTHIRVGPSCISFPMAPPISTNRDWAFLMGLWFGAGGFVSRHRGNGEEMNLRFAVDVRPHRELVQPILIKLGYAAQELKQLYYVNQGHRHKLDAGVWRKYASEPRGYFTLLRPFREIMEKFGLPNDKECLELRANGGKSSCRMFNRTVPKWVKASNAYSHAFVEGFLNGQSTSSTFRVDNKANPRHLERAVEPRFLGKKTIVMPFYKWFANFMEKEEGIKGWDHNLPMSRTKYKTYDKRTHIEKGYLMNSDEALRKLHEQFRLMRSDTRARLYLHYHLDAAWYEICRKLNCFEILLLGAIMEKSQTPEQLAADFRSSPDEVRKVLSKMHRKHKVVKPQGKLWFTQGGFIQDVLADLQAKEEFRRKQEAWAAAQFFSQCDVCGDIITENVKPDTVCRMTECKGFYQPISRLQYRKAKNMAIHTSPRLHKVLAVAKNTLPSFSSFGGCK